MQHVGSTLTGFTLADVAEWLIAVALREGVSAAVDKLGDYLALDHTPILEIIAISGVFPTSRIDLGDGLELVPIADLPGSSSKDRVLGVEVGLGERYLPAVVPTAALVQRTQAHPQLIGVAGRPPGPRYVDHPVEELYAVVPVLTLFGPSSPFPIAHWSQLQPDVPRFGLAESSSGMHQEIMALGIHNGGPIEPSSEIALTISQFMALSKEKRAELDVPLQRLALSNRRHRAIDRVIELGIALESLLVPTKSDQPTKKFIQRGSMYLGGDDQRPSAKILNAMYELRSQAMHSGALDESAVQRFGGVDSVLAQSQTIATRLIRKMIQDGGRPIWLDS